MLTEETHFDQDHKSKVFPSQKDLCLLAGYLHLLIIPLGPSKISYKLKLFLGERTEILFPKFKPKIQEDILTKPSLFHSLI